MIKFKNWTLNIIGVFFVCFGIYAIDYSIYVGQAQWTLWFCYSGMIIIGFGIIIRSVFLIVSQLNILTVPLLFWIGDFFYYLLFQSSRLHVSDYFFEPMAIGARIVSLEHLFLLPLVYLAVYMIGKKPGRAWTLTIIQLVIFFILSRLLTSPEFNVNWVYRPRFLVSFFEGWYVIEWFILGTVFALIINFLLNIPFCNKIKK